MIDLEKIAYDIGVGKSQTLTRWMLPIATLEEMIALIRKQEAALAAPQQHAQAALSDELPPLPDALAKLPWTDQSTADPITKANRVLEGLADASLSYFFHDGYPRDDIAKDAKNVQEVLKHLVARQSAPVAAAAKVAQPEFSRDPDGDLALDWAVGDASLSMSFSKTGAVSWATNVAGKSDSGAQQVAQDSGRDAALSNLLNHVVDDFREMNPSNYTHDEACDLNNWGIEAVGLAQAVQAAMAAQPKKDN